MTPNHRIEQLFAPSTEKACRWIEDVQAESGIDDPQRALSTLRSVLLALRDRLSPAEATDLGAHLPLPLRGVYYEGWRAAARPQRYRHRDAFLEAVTAHYAGNRGDDLERAVAAVFHVLEKHVPTGELVHIRHQLPADVLTLWPRSPRVV